MYIYITYYIIVIKFRDDVRELNTKQLELLIVLWIH